MNRRDRKTFEVGQDVAGARVLEILVREAKPGDKMAYPSRRLAYRVACAHCGHERTIGHSALVERLVSGQKRCRACTRDKGAAPTKATPKDALAIALGAWR